MKTLVLMFCLLFSVLNGQDMSGGQNGWTFASHFNSWGIYGSKFGTFLTDKGQVIVLDGSTESVNIPGISALYNVNIYKDFVSRPLAEKLSLWIYIDPNGLPFDSLEMYLLLQDSIDNFCLSGEKMLLKKGYQLVVFDVAGYFFGSSIETFDRVQFVIQIRTKDPEEVFVTIRFTKLTIDYDTESVVLDLDIPTSVLPSAIPKEFSLSQNYPNPFNPATKIRFSLPERAEVSLKVYDLQGQEVKTLVSEEREAGEHEALFDASGLPSGTYFYRLQVGKFVETKKMLFLK